MLSRRAHAGGGAASAAPPRAPRASDRRSAVRRLRSHLARESAGYLFVAPTCVLVGLFVIYPTYGTLKLSLHDWDGVSEAAEFVGLDNYRRLLSDETFRNAALNNVWWLIALLLAAALGVGLALLLWHRPRGWTAYRTLFLLPEMLGAAIVGLIWIRISTPYSGGLYAIGDLLGNDFLTSGPIGNPDYAMKILLGTLVWSAMGFFVVVALAGLTSVNISTVEAAQIDGANVLQRLRHVVLPAVAPVLELMLLLAVITALKGFDLVWVMTQGGPGNATQLIGTYAYQQAFTTNRFGYAAAMSMVTVVAAVGISGGLSRLRHRSRGAGR